MWAGTSEGLIGILGFNGSVWSQIPSAQGGLISQWIFDVEADPTDALWVGHCCCPVPSDCPMQIKDDAGFQNFYNVLNARVLVPDGSSRMWVGTAADGVVVMERDANTGAWTPAFSLTPESTGGVMASAHVTALAVTSDGTYIGHVNDGIEYWPHNGNLNSGRNGQGWTHVGTGGFGLLDANVGAMTAVGSDVWVGTSGGLHRFRRGILLDRCPTRNRHDPGDQARRVTSMVPDALGGIWMGTDTGVLYLPRGGACDVDGGDFAVFNESNSPLPSNRVTAGALSPTDGAVWMGTATGLLRIDPSVYNGSAAPDRYVIYPNPLDLRPEAGSAFRTVYFGVVIRGAKVASAVPVDAVSQPEIFDLAGKRVGSFARRTSPGSGGWAWTGTNTYGDFVAPGIYVVRTRTAGGEVVTRKVGVLR